MNVQHSTPTTPLREGMIADMSARNLGPASQVGHLRACKRFAPWLGAKRQLADRLITRIANTPHKSYAEAFWAYQRGRRKMSARPRRYRSQ